MLAHRRRDTDSARLGERLQPRRNVHGVAEEIAVLDYDVADMNTDAKKQTALVWEVLTVLCHRPLDRKCAGETLGDTGKLGNHRVARRIGNPAVMLGDQTIRDRSTSDKRR